MTVENLLKNGFGAVATPETDREITGVYIGDLREGKPYGSGILVFANRDAHIGTFENGLAEGQGAYVYFNNGDCYHGQWHNHKLNGIATLVIGKNGSTWHNVYKDGIYGGSAPAL